MSKRLLKFLDSNLAVYIVLGIAIAIPVAIWLVKLHYIIKYW